MTLESRMNSRGLALISLIQAKYKLRRGYWRSINSMYSSQVRSLQGKLDRVKIPIYISVEKYYISNLIEKHPMYFAYMSGEVKKKKKMAKMAICQEN